MNRKYKHVLDALVRARQYILDHPDALANAQLVVHSGQLDGVIATMTQHRNGQDLGLGQFADGSTTKAESAREIRRQLKRISKIGKELEPAEFPDVRQSLRMPAKGYRELAARTETFLTTIAPIKAAFVDRGLRPDFDAQLRAALVKF